MRKESQIAKTSGLLKFAGAYGFLHDQKGEQMGLIYGAPGVGKTTAAIHLASQYDANYISLMPMFSPFTMVNHILLKMGLSPTNSYVKGLDRIIERLAMRQTALFLDETDFLPDSAALLDTVRVIHDQAKVPVMLIGMTGIYAKLADKKLFVDRIQCFLEITGCSLEDTALIADIKCAAKLKPCLLAHIQAETKGNARQIQRVVAHIEQLALANEFNEIGMDEWGDRKLLPANSSAPTKARRAA